MSAEFGITPEQAKLKTCPTIRYCQNEAQVIQEGQGPIYYHSHCIGPDCMVWRWTPGENELRGYCGLTQGPS